MSSFFTALFSLNRQAFLALIVVSELVLMVPLVGQQVWDSLGKTLFVNSLSPVEELPSEFELEVPFTPQAPDGNWALPYQEACEESSLIMVKYFYDENELSRRVADQEIVRMVEWQTSQGYTIDIDAQETLEVARSYYGMDGYVFYDEEVTLERIKQLIASGYPVIIPAAGRLLANPNYRGLGPPYHMLVIIGYDDHYFITHDPGTRFGEEYRYSYELIDNAIHDWVGSKDMMVTGRRAMVVLLEKE